MVFQKLSVMKSLHDEDHDQKLDFQTWWYLWHEVESSRRPLRVPWGWLCEIYGTVQKSWATHEKYVQQFIWIYANMPGNTVYKAKTEFAQF